MRQCYCVLWCVRVAGGQEERHEIDSKGGEPRNAQRSGCEGLLGVWLDCWVNRGCEKLKLFEGVAYVD